MKRRSESGYEDWDTLTSGTKRHRGVAMDAEYPSNENH
jgi:hypothetical protein